MWFYTNVATIVTSIFANIYKSVIIYIRFKNCIQKEIKMQLYLLVLVSALVVLGFVFRPRSVRSRVLRALRKEKFEWKSSFGIDRMCSKSLRVDVYGWRLYNEEVRVSDRRTGKELLSFRAMYGAASTEDAVPLRKALVAMQRRTPVAGPLD